MTIYVEPPEVVPGQVMSATNWKDWVVDVARAMWVYTAAGDLEYALSANQKARLGIGASQSLLMSNGSAPAWFSKGAAVSLLKVSNDGTALDWLAKGTADSLLKVNGAGSALEWLARGTAASILRVNSAGSALAWFAKGGANQVLGMNAGGTDLEWKSDIGAVKGARVVNASFALADATLTNVQFTAESIDENNYWNIGVPTRITIPDTGWYFIGVYVSYANNSNGRRMTNVIINGTTAVVATDYRMPVTGGTTNVSMGMPYYLNAGDYIELQVYQTSGAGLTVAPSVMTIAKV